VVGGPEDGEVSHGCGNAEEGQSFLEAQLLLLERAGLVLTLDEDGRVSHYWATGRGTTDERRMADAILKRCHDEVAAILLDWWGPDVVTDSRGHLCSRFTPAQAW